MENKHYVVEKSVPIGDGEWAMEYECSCGSHLEVVFSNGTKYDERAGEFHGYYPADKKKLCKVLREILNDILKRGEY
jgi:hypothetical protein